MSVSVQHMIHRCRRNHVNFVVLCTNDPSRIPSEVPWMDFVCKPALSIYCKAAIIKMTLEWESESDAEQL